MDLRIGIAQSSQVIELEVSEDTDRDQLKADVASALGQEDGVFWVADRKGKEIAVPSAKISFVEIGAASAARRIGFGA